MAKLTESQERLTNLERRQREVAERLAALDGHDVDPAAVVRLLIERVDYTGASGELKMTFSGTGAKLLTAELTS
jgi:hypothetical protein